MEPVPLSTAAIATLVLTKAFEKTSKILGEDVVKEGDKLAQLLRYKFPSTASAIELAQEQPLNYGQALLEKVQVATKLDSEIAEAQKKVEAVAKIDPNFAKAVQSVAEALTSQPLIVQDNGKLVEQIQAIIQGSNSNDFQENIYTDLTEKVRG